MTPLGRLYLVGVAVVAALLVYEQSLVSADDLSQVKRAFDLNGYVGILYLIVLAASIYGTVSIWSSSHLVIWSLDLIDWSDWRTDHAIQCPNQMTR